MATAVCKTRAHGNASNLFILVVTVVSLVIMVLLLMPVSSTTKDLLRAYDNLICVIFLADFFTNLTRASSNKEFFIDQRGWLDLLGSIPAIRGFQALGILRLARLSRLERVYRLISGKNRKQLLDDMVYSRARYTVVITVLAAAVVMMAASILVVNAESRSNTANITTGGDAIWWTFVTITTVGYGDRFPTTFVGQIAGVKDELIALRRLVERMEARSSRVEPADTETAGGLNEIDPDLSDTGQRNA
jgi:voltage-gated potassium channel